MIRILIVEDEPTIARGLKDDLELDGYVVETAGDGETACIRSRDGKFDLILLDIMLPRKDGFAVCRELRQAGSKAPIILLTAKGQEIDRVLGLELGADDYVTKPFSSRELKARIKAVLRRTTAGSKNEPAQTVFEFGDVRVDFERFELFRNAEKVEMTALEFKLLRAFLGHRGKVLSIDQIFAEVWDKNACLTDRVIYTHVNNLRNKIEADPAHPRHLVSVRGVGYRFDG